MKPINNNYTFYKIINEDVPDYIYIGSTCNFIRRKSEHKSKCNNPASKRHNIKIYQTIRANGGWNKWNMIIIDKLDNSTLLDARIREEALILKYRANMNSFKAHITAEERIENAKEYYKLNNENIKEKKKANYEKNKENVKEYRQLNKEAIKEQRKLYRETNKKTIKEIKKAYYETNKDSINEQKKANYEKNKDEINEKMTCDCGSVFRKRDLPRHKRTIKHQNYCETIDLNSK